MLELTSQEKKTIIFILCLLLLGIGIDFLRKKTPAYGLIDYEALKERLFEKVDINKATLSELRTMPKLGEKTAQAIIEYRNSYGEFKSLEELKKVKGIKDKKLTQLKKYIKLSD